MIKMIVVGKVKEDYFKDAIKEYEKRISKYTKLKIIEVPDENYEISKTLLKEKDNILKYIDEKDYVISLDIDSTQLDSIEFSKKIDKLLAFNKDICFIIGGSYGLHNDIKIRSDESISFSKMTFPHQLFRVIFLEQLYRAFKIINNEAYHK